MASSEKKNDDEVNTWDSDIEISSDDNDTQNDNKQNENEQESQSQSNNTSSSKINPPSKPAPPPSSNNNDESDDDQKMPNDPIDIKLALFNNYSQSKVYQKIRQRRIQKKTNNDSDIDTNTDNDNEEKVIDKKKTKKKKKVTINDLKSNRILYEMNNYEYKWFWIDSLPTDDNTDYIWLQQYSNINLFPSQRQQTKGIIISLLNDVYLFMHEM